MLDLFVVIIVIIVTEILDFKSRIMQFVNATYVTILPDFLQEIILFNKKHGFAGGKYIFWQ